MHSLKLNIDDKIYENILWLLRKFSADELEIIFEETDHEKSNMFSKQDTNSNDFDQYSISLRKLNDKYDMDKNKLYLESELKKIKEGNAAFYSINEVEHSLNLILKKHENKN